MVRNILHWPCCAVRSKSNISLGRSRDVWSNENAVPPSSVLSRTRRDFSCFVLPIGKTKLNRAVSAYGATLDPFRGESFSETQAGITYYALDCPTDHHNAMAVRAALPRTGPRPIEARRSFGCGDRIGGMSPATPWHIEACSRYGISPALAQQSVRELPQDWARTFGIGTRRCPT
jgi:hypothetical protein